MKKFSFWVIPENNLYNEFEEVTSKYSKEYGSPKFVPHMTLHGPVFSTDEEVVKKVEKAVSEIDSFEMEMGEVEFSTTTNQCVFVRIKTSAKLLEVHLALRKVLNFEEDHVFMPHASLVYGDFSMKKREKIAKEIELIGKSFTAHKITIVRADTSDPKDWEVVGQVSLGKS